MQSIFKWLKNVLIAIDQLGNTLAGGKPDITISARVGYFANISKNKSLLYYWRFLEWVIDTTFYPLDGPKHCLQAYRGDNEQGHQHGSDFMRAVLGFIVVFACLFISIVTWTAYVLGYRPAT